MATRRVLQMSDDELRAVVAVVVPGRRTTSLRRDEMHEMCFKWLFANGLSINHGFELHVIGGDDVVVMSSKKACTCCPKVSDEATMRDFDRSPLGVSLLSNATKTRVASQPELPSESATSKRAAEHAKIHATKVDGDSQANQNQKPSSAVRTQPRPTQNVFPAGEAKTTSCSGIPVKAPDRKKEGFCMSMKRECGYCCMSLCSNL